MSNQLIERIANPFFSLRLLKSVLGDSSENQVVSPASIATAFALALNGAAGATSADIKKTLGYRGLNDSDVNDGLQAFLAAAKDESNGVQMNIANAMWLDQGFPFKEEFLSVNKEKLNAEANAMDFADPRAADIINAWVGKETKGRIPKIVDDPVSGPAILTNAVHYLGKWTDAFDKSLTDETANYYLGNGEQIKHPLMLREEEMHYGESESLQVVQIPYGAMGSQRRFGMLVIKPKGERSLENLQHMQKKLLGTTDRDWKTTLYMMSKREGVLQLPRFKAACSYELSAPLKKLGMASAFDETRADFSNMAHLAANQRLYIGKVNHKTFIETTEQGTEASAATSIEMLCGCTSYVAERPKPFEMIVDGPFMFAIRDRYTGMLLFIGSIVDPRGADS